jgi:subtilisin family serine protease
VGIGYWWLGMGPAVEPVSGAASQFQGPPQSRPKIADTPATPAAAPALSVVPRDRFASSPTIAQRQEVRTEHGAVKVHRLRLVQKDDFKYPVVRVADELVRDTKGDRLTKQMAMVGDHVLIKVRDPKMDAAVLLNQLQDSGATLRRKMPGSGIWLIAFANPTLDTVPQAISRLSALSQWVRYAEPDYLVEATAAPNDASFATQWGMNNTGQSGGLAHADIQAPDAWSLATGSSAIVVGILDSGMDLTHPDLAANLWTNPNETPGNGIDDDSNGFVDDVHGWDFVHNGNNPTDDFGHGTHCAGIIGAMGNNSAGVSGVCWQVSLLPLKFLNSSGTGASSDAITAMAYATQAQVTLTSNSYSIIGEGYSQSMKDAIDEADVAGILFVTGTGNLHVDIDASPGYPGSYTSSNLIAVAATTRLDELASYSNFGAVGADLAAPGTDIYSTSPNGAYGLSSGTSMAAPHVAGACALLKSLKPELTHAEIKNLILSSVDVIPSLAGKTLTGGRLNLYNALIASNDILVSRGADFAASGLVGGPFTPASKTYTLTNHQSVPAAWTAAVNRSWISPSPAGGTLDPGATVTVTLAFNAEAPAMLAGDHTGIITFTSVATGRTYLRDLTVTVSPPALYSVNLDTDPGWPRTGSWAYGIPTGQGGTSAGRPDPLSGATGIQVFGVNLNGNYPVSIGPPEYLTAGPFNLSSHHSNKLRFQRWLNSDYQPWVHASIEVSPNGSLWYPVWENGTTALQTDSHWTQVTYDLPAAVDGQTQVYVRWRHEVGNSGPIPLSGWNVDDIEILGIPDRLIRLTMPGSVTEGGTAGIAKISIVPAIDTDRVINLSSDRPGQEVSFPATITIPAGAEEATFEVTPLDDATADGTQTVALTSSAPGFVSHTASLPVHDNESLSLTLSLPTGVTEGDGIVTGMAEVTLPSAAAADIQISLASSDTTELLVPATATIAAGQTAVAIPLTVLDDSLLDGTQTVTLTASVANWPTATDTLEVLDNESRQLTVVLPSSRLENSGTVIAAATVSTAAIVETSLTIILSSDDVTELIVPAQVTIPAGSASAAFELAFQDDALTDGAQTVHVSASAATFITGSSLMTVNDNDTPALPVDPTPADGLLSVHPESDLAWQTDPDSGGVPESYDLYFGTDNSPDAEEFITNTTLLHWALPRLTPGATYYWQVIARKGLATRAGPVWSFAVPPVGAVKHFVWDPLPVNTPVATPIAVHIGAFDEYDNPVTSFTDRATLAALVQAPVSITGTGAVVNTAVLGTFYKRARTQAIYLPAEVGPSGSLTELALNVSGVPGQMLNNFTIRLKHTAKSTYSGSATWETSGWTTVYQSNAMPTSTGWAWFAFNTPFSYNGSNNLMVDISFDNVSFSTDGRCLASTAASYRSLNFRTDSSTYGTPTTWNGATPSGSISMTLPNISFRRADVPLTISPVITGLFTAGTWSGNVTITESGANVRLKAEFAADPSVSGLSDPLDIININEFALHAEPAFTGGLTNKITWLTLGDGYDYEIQCSTTPDFSAVVSTGFITASEYTFTELTNATPYYYRGRARGNDVVGNWSAVIQSTQDVTPPNLTFLPASATVTSQDSVTLTGTGIDAGSGVATVTVDGTTAATTNAFAAWNSTLNSLPNGMKSVIISISDNAVPPNTHTENWTILRIASPDADSDHNGVSSLLEYALNTAGPGARDALPVITAEGDVGSDDRYLTVTYRRRLTPAGLNYLLEISSNLTDWQAAGDNAVTLATTPTGDGVTEAVRVRILPALQTGQSFVRLRVVIP